MYQFVVTGRNVALGIFPDMASALCAMQLSDPDIVQLEFGEWHANYWSFKERTVLGVVAVRPSTKPEPMF